MSVQTVDTGLWTIDHALTVGGLALGTRTSVIRLGDGGLALLSPGPLGDDAAAAIAALGPVRALVAPNLLHHLSLATARARFPGARLYAPPGLAAKQPALPIDAPLGDWPHGDTLLPLPVGGMPKLDETAWLHRASRTLVLTDLAFNLRPPAPWFTRLFMRLNGGFDRFGPTRLCRSLVRDRAAVRAGLDAILAHDFDRVIVAHGRILATGGRDALREGFAWLRPLITVDRVAGRRGLARYRARGRT